MYYFNVLRVLSMNKIISMYKLYTYIALLLFVLFSPFNLYSQDNIVPQGAEPVATLVDEDGSNVELAPGDEYTGEAPFSIQFSAKADEYDGFSRVCTWRFIRNEEPEPFLTRYDADVDYEFRESGTYTVLLIVTYTSRDNSDIVWEFEYDPFIVIISESSLKVPNAFSPNGDGINDYFNVYDVKSIVSFNAAIYNRWGQQLYSWGIDEIDCENCGWDGTYKGKPVKEGTYFVVVNARGADGIKYEFKKDVNLLRGYIENVNP